MREPLLQRVLGLRQVQPSLLTDEYSRLLLWRYRKQERKHLFQSLFPLSSVASVFPSFIHGGQLPFPSGAVI